MMKRYSLPLFFTLVALVVTGCTYDPAFEGLEEVSVNYRGDPVDAFLDITVGELSVSMETRAEDEDPYEDTEAERWVNDIWVFQYDATDKTAIADPIFISISDSTKGYDQEILKNLPVTLSDNKGDLSLIYVVANAGSDSTWGSNFKNETLLLSATLHTREPVMVTKETQNGDLSIPMEGNSEAVQVVANTVVRVPVTRMYAKIMIDPVLELQNSEIYSVGVGSIPLYCQVGSLYSGNDVTGATYPSDVQWISRTFTESLATDEDESTLGPGIDLGYRYIVYVPENLQGQAGDASTLKLDQTSSVPARALQVNIVIKYTDTEGGTIEYPYTFYPGANTTNDYNIKRNNIYRVKANIRTISLARVPSANCFFAFAGETISFYPYYREETSGGYDFSAYLNPYGAEDAQVSTGAKIDHVGIVWQTKDCIGDNSNGDLVWFSAGAGAANLSQTGYEQIHVKTYSEGNALIAAYDTENNIIWSWHIWVRLPGKKDPTNEANAILYYTYDWDENGIYGYESQRDRIAGYEIMSCNLGALEDEPIYNENLYFGYHYDDWTSGMTYTEPYGKSTNPYRVQTFQSGDNIVRTFGMMYQWGRKDPFPPSISTEGGNSAYNTGCYVHNYSNELKLTEQLYDNANEPTVNQTSYEYSDYLFHSHLHDAETDGITGVRYSIAHPTVFLCGTNEVAGCFNRCSVGSADNTDYLKTLDNYAFGGAWSDEDHDNCEWGGSDPSSSTGMKSLDLGTLLGMYDDLERPIVIYDDYEGVSTGKSKSIFDPCPYGWRVGSGDLWLGFTKNGANTYYEAKISKDSDGKVTNTGSMENVNYDPDKSCILGLTMYMGTADNSWRAGETSWFPNQGFRLPDGSGYRVGFCGNYVNANTSVDERVNIIHTHDRYEYFRQFETQLHYTVKSTANALRCVRDQL